MAHRNDEKCTRSLKRETTNSRRSQVSLQGTVGESRIVLHWLTSPGVERLHPREHASTVHFRTARDGTQGQPLI